MRTVILWASIALILDLPLLAILVWLIVRSEQQRKKRIEQGLPLEDVEPQGFQVELNQPKSEDGERK